MIHLTLTGWGSRQERRLCTAPVLDSETHWHAMYCRAAQLENPNLCRACVRIWKDDSDDAESAERKE